MGYSANNNEAEARLCTMQSALHESRCHRNSGVRGLIIGTIPQYARRYLREANIWT